MSQYVEAVYEIADEAMLAKAGITRLSRFKVTVTTFGICVSWLDKDDIESASVWIENYGGPIRAHIYNTEDENANDATATITLVEDPETWTPEKDETDGK